MTTTPVTNVNQQAPLVNSLIETGVRVVVDGALITCYIGIRAVGPAALSWAITGDPLTGLKYGAATAITHLIALQILGKNLGKDAFFPKIIGIELAGDVAGAIFSGLKSAPMIFGSWGTSILGLGAAVYAIALEDISKAKEKEAQDGVN